MIYKRKKPSLTFYVDYVIHDNKCYMLYETLDGRIHKKFICETFKASCDDLRETESYIYITI